MRNIRSYRNTLTVLAGALVLSAFATAIPFDTQIKISRALNSPTLTIRYNGANAATVELRINGVSYATRAADSAKSTGETNFDLVLSELNDGDNEVEVVLYDKDGKRVGSQKSIVTTESGIASPVFISSPKMGAEVRGPLDIEVGFGQQMRNVYVSFFVNNEFRMMRNSPPYSYRWDTTKLPNGWHELEAWVVDDTSMTFKSRKVKVFVNNPSGNTTRVTPPVVKPVLTPVKPVVTPPAKPPVKPAVKVAPKLELAPNSVSTSVGAQTGPKAIKLAGPVTSGPKVMTPTGTRNAVPIKVNPPVTPVVNTVPVAVTTAAPGGMVSVNKGVKLPAAGKYAIMVNTRFVNFDVDPRIQNGVPLTPFRHLFEEFGGTVKWESLLKEVNAEGEGKSIWLKIGDSSAKVNGLPVKLELAPFIERGRTMLPLSFIREALDVEVDYDPATGHVLITTVKK